jgi:hypothetical protein
MSSPPTSGVDPVPTAFVHIRVSALSPSGVHARGNRTNAATIKIVVIPASQRRQPGPVSTLSGSANDRRTRRDNNRPTT